MAIPGKMLLNISRPQYGDGRKMICVRIRDAASRIMVAELEVPYDAFTECLTGVSEVEANVAHFVPELAREFIGMKRETMTLQCEKVWGKPHQRRIVHQDMKERGLFENGWEVFSDGTGSQQHGSKHQYTVFRYVEPEGRS